MTLSKKLAVIIPTLGRESLIDVIRSINAFEEENVSIYVIPDGENAVKRLGQLQVTNLPNTFVHPNRQKIGIAACINLGLERLSKEEHFSIFSDDDMWLTSRTKALNHLEKSIDAKTIIMGRFSSNDKINVAQMRKLNFTDPIEFVYRKSLGRNKNYLTITSGIFPLITKSTHFRTDYLLREDLIWMHDLSSHGFNFIESPEIFVHIKKNYSNTVNRETTHEVQKFKKFLILETSIKLNDFSAFHAGRSAAKLGKPKHFYKITLAYKDPSKNYNIFQYFAITLNFFYAILYFVKGLFGLKKNARV
jgi:hypothetical protein